jgi:hypothetical protein
VSWNNNLHKAPISGGKSLGFSKIGSRTLLMVASRFCRLIDKSSLAGNRNLSI